LAGYIDLFTHQRVQILGNTENQYLSQLSVEEQKKALGNLLQFEVPCLFLTENNSLGPELVEMVIQHNIPLYRTPVPSTEFAYFLRDFLEDQFAPQQTVHGSLVDVYGAGLLLIGQPGIGKSEIALDLVERGHRLVADDVVVVTRKSANLLIGSGTDLAEHFMEIRGLGLVDVRAMFGIRAIRFQKRVEVVVDLHVWRPEEEYTRIGMVEDIYPLLGVEIPRVKLPIVPGKNITVICEVIAMNYLLQHYGYDAAEVFTQRLNERLIQKRVRRNAPQRGIEYFEHDYE
jgi:HPr kinase/phosphorylase